jgi:hypothetical protein
VAIAAAYLQAIRFVALTSAGVTIKTRLRSKTLPWKDVDSVAMARSMGRRGPGLSLVFLPKDAAATPVEIDLNHGRSTIRARSYLIREITRLHTEPVYAPRETLKLKGRKISTF